MPRMQTLGVSDSTPKSDSRLKNIFWPTIRSGTDVDTLGSQGFWICVIVGVFCALTNAFAGQALPGFLLFLYFYFGGMGVREHSCYAASAVFAMFLVITVMGPGILTIAGCVLLLSVLRATFIASFWEKREGMTEMPIRFNETWKDKFADQWPAWLWPKVRIVYYIYSVVLFALMSVGVVISYMQRYGMIPRQLLHR